MKATVVGLERGCGVCVLEAFHKLNLICCSVSFQTDRSLGSHQGCELLYVLSIHRLRNTYVSIISTGVVNCSCGASHLLFENRFLEYVI